MSRHAEITRAYRQAKMALGSSGHRSRSRTQEDGRAYFDRTLDALRAEIAQYKMEQQWLQRWQRIAFHCSRQGINISALDRPLHDLNRG
jgi:hypothetical protein